ncbi:hypothetical protein NKR19_g10365, partial [Coniochaeta hoffmannii]
FPPTLQGNLFLGILSTLTPSPPSPPSLSTILSPTSLPLLAAYTRHLTTSATPALLSSILAALAPVRNKKALSVRVDSFPPMSVVVTDWRDARGVCGEADFGWRGGRARGFRHLFGGVVSEGLVVVYPPRVAGPRGGDEEGVEVLVTVEREVGDELMGDAEWGEWFEGRGFDVDA